LYKLKKQKQEEFIMNFKIKRKQVTLMEALQTVVAVVNQSFDEDGAYYPFLCEAAKKGIFMEKYTDYEFQDDVEENYAQYAGIRIEDYKDDINYEQWKDMEKSIDKEIEFRLKRGAVDYVFHSMSDLIGKFGEGFNLEKSEELLEKLSRLKNQLPSPLAKEVS